jgi:hypothetical protein
MFPLFQLFTEKQHQDLNHFYFTCLNRLLFCLHWSDNFFSFADNEISLEDRSLRKDPWQDRGIEALRKKIFLMFLMRIWKQMSWNHQTHIFSSFGCTIEKLALTDFSAMHTNCPRTGKNHLINIYQEYNSMSWWSFSSNLLKDRVSTAEKTGYLKYCISSIYWNNIV